MRYVKLSQVRTNDTTIKQQQQQQQQQQKNSETNNAQYRDSICKAREAFLIPKGRTIDPNSLNIHEETYYIILFHHIDHLHCQLV